MHMPSTLCSSKLTGVVSLLPRDRNFCHHPFLHPGMLNHCHCCCHRCFHLPACIHPQQLYKTLMFPSPTLSLFLKMFLFCNTGQMPVESVRLQLPLLWQMLGTGGKAVALFVSEFTNGALCWVCVACLRLCCGDE